MTNEEAKKLLQNNLDFEKGKKGIYPCPIEQYIPALKVAIEALETHDDLCENLTWYINERQRLLKVIEYSKPNEGLQRTIQKALERPHGEWIPCSERLPEEDGKYLVCWCGAWGVDICFAEYSKCGKYWYEKYGGEYRGITAWMPLPEPYKAESEE